MAGHCLAFTPPVQRTKIEVREDAAVIAGGGSGNALEDIMNTPLARCDEPAWTLAGISLAGYNFLVSSAAALSIFVLMVKDRNA